MGGAKAIDPGTNKAAKRDQLQDPGAEVHYTTSRQLEHPVTKTTLSNIKVGIDMSTWGMGRVKLRGGREI